MTQDIHFPSPSSDEKDEDESRTALGTAPPAFTPQPNAFSHPPGAGLTPRNVSGRERERDSYFAPQHGYAARQRMSHPSTNRAASDAALRASLTTLLSCAQAARSLPKRSSTTVQGPGLVRAQNEMQEFRMVPESDLLGDAPPPRSAAAVTPPALAAMQSAAQTSPNVRARSSATVSSDEKEGIGKRAATSQTRRKRRAVTVQAQDTQVHQRLLESVSPTLLTWIVSAGVVVFVSVVGFGAGYAMGYESGKEEGRLLSCGKSVPVRVRRFRWGGGSGITA